VVLYNERRLLKQRDRSVLCLPHKIEIAKGKKGGGRRKLQKGDNPLFEHIFGSLYFLDRYIVGGTEDVIYQPQVTYRPI